MAVGNVEKMGDRRKFPNPGDILHIIQIFALVFTLGEGYNQFQEMKKANEEHGARLVRMEHYLSSKDPNYWKKTTENGDGENH